MKAAFLNAGNFATRIGWPAAIALALGGLIVWQHPAQAQVIGLKVALLAIGAGLGYTIDRWCAPYARPHTLSGLMQAMALQRRSIIVAAAIIGMALAI